MNCYRLAVVLLLAYTLPILSQTPTAASVQPSLAIVALPDYIDATGSKNYAYLGPSLTDAINNSMQERFDFQRADKAVVDREVKKLWRSGKVPLDSDVKQIAILTRSDYVIVGSYTLNPRKTQVTFSTRVFVAPDRFIQVPEVTNAVDATLFDATNKVAAEIVRVIEADARAQQAKLAAATPAAKPGEKIALAKAAEAPPPQPAPAPAKKSAQAEEDESPYEERNAITAGLSYQGNYFERHTQFYRYSSAMTTVDVGLHLVGAKIYGQLGLPSTPSGGSIPQAYKNSGFWLLGLESETHLREGLLTKSGWARFGLNYRSFSEPNPAANTVRDLLNWSSTIYADSGFHVANIGPVALGISLASYLDLMSASYPTNLSSDLLMQLNLELGGYMSYRIPVVGVLARLDLGSSFALYDQTSERYVISFGEADLDGLSRKSQWSGWRYSLSFSRSYWGANFRLWYVAYPSIAESFQPVDEQNKLRNSAGYLGLSASYRLGLR